MKEEPIKGYFAFEDNDLIANRDDKLSEKQSKRFKEADRFLLALFLVLLAATLFIGILAFHASNNIGLWAGIVILLLIAIWLFQGLRGDIDDTIQKVEGEVFGNVNPVLIESMQGGTYAVYFTKPTRQILFVEQISNGSNSPV